MWQALFWGMVSASSLILGGTLAYRLSIGRKALGIIMAFGAGTLISAISYELIYEALQLAKGTGFTAYGLFGGAITYYFADRLIMKMGSAKRSSIGDPSSAALVVPMLLGIILDGIPESIVIGLGLSEGGTVSMAMLAAVFISNLPESIAGSTGMLKSGWKQKKIIILWFIIATICAGSTVLGYSVFSGASRPWLGFIQAFAGGAILMMLANSMMPEAFEHGGKQAGLFTVLGFAISVLIVILERG